MNLAYADRLTNQVRERVATNLYKQITPQIRNLAWDQTWDLVCIQVRFQVSDVVYFALQVEFQPED